MTDYEGPGAVKSEHPMGASHSQQYDHDAHREELWGDAREAFDRDTFEDSVNKARSEARAKYDRETIIRAYVLGNRDDMTYPEVAKELGEDMHPNTVGKIVRGVTHSHIMQDVKV